MEKMDSALILLVVVLGQHAAVVNPFQDKYGSGLVTSFRDDDEQHVCSIYIYTDPFLWRQVHKIEGMAGA